MLLNKHILHIGLYFAHKPNWAAHTTSNERNVPVVSRMVLILTRVVMAQYHSLVELTSVIHQELSSHLSYDLVLFLTIILYTFCYLSHHLHFPIDHMICFPVPKMVYTIQPNTDTAAVWLNTAPQLLVASRICPAIYTPINPGMAPAKFIMPVMYNTV